MRFTRDAGRVVIVGRCTDHGAVSTKAAFNPHLDLNKKQRYLLDARATAARGQPATTDHARKRYAGERLEICFA